MQDIFFPPTENSLEFKTIAEKGEIYLSGISNPESIFDLFTPFNQWLETYFKNPAPETCVYLQLTYLSNSSSLMILDLLKRLDAWHKQGKPVRVVWSYSEGDEDMMEDGEDFQQIVHFPFEMKING